MMLCTNAKIYHMILSFFFLNRHGFHIIRTKTCLPMDPCRSLYPRSLHMYIAIHGSRISEGQVATSVLPTPPVASVLSPHMHSKYSELMDWIHFTSGTSGYQALPHSSSWSITVCGLFSVF